MPWHAVAAYLDRIFLDPDLRWWPSRDVILGLVFTALSFGVGWAASRRAGRKRMRSRLADELILSQREMARRAYPDDFDGIWRRDDERSQWMLEPFATRLRFVISNLGEDRAVSSRARELCDVYVEKVIDFISLWSHVKTRKARYDYRFFVMHDAFVAALTALGPRDGKKLRGIVPKRFAMKVRSQLIIGLPEPPPEIIDEEE